MDLPDEAATSRAAEAFASLLFPGDLVFLEGPLGAGKTTFARGLLRALGWLGPVRSPSYALVRSYPLPTPVHHLDLYRLSGPEEAEGLDLDELFTPDAICLVEWPDRLEGRFPSSWGVRLDVTGASARRLHVRKGSPPGSSEL